jgi:hypothetical protein
MTGGQSGCHDDAPDHLDNASSHNVRVASEGDSNMAKDPDKPFAEL